MRICSNITKTFEGTFIYQTICYIGWQPFPPPRIALHSYIWSVTNLMYLLTYLLDTDKARLIAIWAQHSSEWLFALPISACGLRLGDEAIRVAVVLRLGVNICEPYTYPCGANIDARGLHGLACKRSADRSTRHQQINDLIWRALKRADILSTK